MVPESPFAQGIVRITAASAESVPEGIQKRIEIVVADDEYAFRGVLFVVILECLDQLQSDGGFAGAFFAEDDGGAGIAAVSEDFIPCWMMDGFGAVMLEDVIGLRVFLTEWIDANAVMFKELLEFHKPGVLETKNRQQSP